MNRHNAPKSNRNPVYSLSLMLAAAALIGTPAIAQDEEPATRIETDTERGTITFLVDGEPVGVFDKNGLKVYGDVYHSGFIQNSSPPYPDAGDKEEEETHDDQ